MWPIVTTNNIYQIIDATKILVEVRAGFFVEKSSRDAMKVLERKS